MSTLIVIVALYLLIGTVYAFYLLFIKVGGIFSLPINILGGPIALSILLIKVLRKERL